MNENENINEENMERNSNEILDLEEGASTEENGEDVTQNDMGSDAPEETGESEILTVSSGDSYELSLILEELQLQTDVIEEMQLYQEEKDTNIFEKSLSNYTTSEAILLFTFLFSIAQIIIHWIGGIIKCEK